MSTITKERIANLLQFNSEGSDCQANAEQWEVHELARIALASLEAEAVCVIDQANLDYLKSGSDADVWPASRIEMGDVLLYRAAMLQGADGNSPVIPDGLRLALSNAGIAAPESDEMLAATCEKYFQELVTWVKDRKPFQPAAPDFREIVNSSTNNFRENEEASTKCWCHTCRPVTNSDMRFVVCPECGNKRCPHANDHRHACTGSNEPGQEGSAYPAPPQQEAKP